MRGVDGRGDGAVIPGVRTMGVGGLRLAGDAGGGAGVFGVSSWLAAGDAGGAGESKASAFLK